MIICEIYKQLKWNNLFHFNTVIWGILILCIFTFSQSCKNDVNVLTADDDVNLGRQLDLEVANNTSVYRILPASQYSKAYAEIERIGKSLINTGKVEYREKFNWSFRILQDDNNINCFSVPGGYVYVTTGLIKFAENESQFAGILAHEIAHTSRRHVSEKLSLQYGSNNVLDALLGRNPTLLVTMAGSISYIPYTQNHELDADLQSIQILCPTDYAANGFSEFCKKIIKDPNNIKIANFKSNHPEPDKGDDRITRIENEIQALNCLNSQKYEIRYQQFKSMVP